MKPYTACGIIVLICMWNSIPCNGQNLGRLAAALHQQLPGHDTGISGPEQEGDLIVATEAFDVLSQYWRAELPARLEAGLFERLSNSCVAGWQYLFNPNNTAPGSKSPLIPIPPLPLWVYALDAFGKPPGAGYLQGNSYAYGSYDECLDTDHTQYCNGPLRIVSIAQTPPAVLAQFTLGMCLPQECSKRDIEIVVNDTNVVLSFLRDRQIFFYMNKLETDCRGERNPPFNAGAIIMIFISSLFALMAVLGTATDWLLKLTVVKKVATGPEQFSVNQDSEKTHLLGGTVARTEKKHPKFKFYDFITAFSLYKTVPTILATKQPPSAITSINGIRVISMFWVILCHTHLWVFTSAGVKNTTKMIGVASRFSFQVIINGFFSVDSFFFLSGLLVAYLTLRDLNRRRGRFPALMYYIHRYLRITPTYAFVLFFQWFLTVHLTDGPLFISRYGPGSPPYETCNQYWWTNLLYINNFYPWKLAEECMGWTWYLANDMQFYIVAPLMVVMLYYSLPLGLMSVGIFLFGSFIATGSIAGYYEFYANTFYPLFAGSNETFVTMSTDELYTKPYGRISPYLVGIVLGYLFYRKAQIPFTKSINWIFYLCLWILAIFFCTSTLYGFYGTWHGHPFNLAENVVYYIFSRFTWALGLALLVFICHNGYGGVVNSFLSMNFWVPLSRLTFNAYLVHPIILTVIFSSVREPLHYTDITMAVYAIAAVVLSYSVAGVVAAFVEFPLSNIEATVFKLLGFGSRESTRQATEVAETQVPPKEPVFMSKSCEMPN